MISSHYIAFDFSSFPSISQIVIAIIVSTITYAIYIREATPLRSIPGPFLASITRLWIYQQQSGCQRQNVDINLHQKYGPIVRISPNEVLVSSPESLKAVYSAGSKFRKGDWYRATGDCGWTGPDELDLLPETNMEKYRLQRRVIRPAYSTDAMKDIEKNLDIILEKNVNIMRRLAGQSTDIDIFFNFFALDCLTMATFSEPKGLVEINKDDGSVISVHKAWTYMHLVGFFPWIHRFNAWFLNFVVQGWMTRLKHLPLFFTVKRREVGADAENVFGWGSNKLRARMETRDNSLSDPPSDIVSKLFQAQAEKPAFKDSWLRSIVMTNFGAGVETIAITVGSLICNIISHPGCQERVQEEIHVALKAGKLSRTPKLRELQESLPYLSACISESMRLCPVVGMPLVRVVPEGGRELEGHFLPAGTTVGINPWVIGRDKSVYGEDADKWRPERWLEYSPTQLKYLETCSMAWGIGARTCPGKHLAQAIYTKMIPMVFMNFDWRFTDPKAERKTQCMFSAKLVDVMVQWKVKEG